MPSSAIDELLKDLHYLIGSALGPASKNFIADFLNYHNLKVDKSHK